MENQKQHICKFCGKEFKSGQSLGAHIIGCKLNPKSNNLRKKISKSKTLERKERKIICKVCGKEFIIICTDNDFNKKKYKQTCSAECAHKLTSLNTNKEIKNKNISKSLSGKFINQKPHIHICEYCGKEFEQQLYNGRFSRNKYCSIDCLNNGRHYKLSCNAKKSNLGGYNPNSIKKHKHGNYNGIHYDSSWELAFLIYCFEHNISVQRCCEVRTYIDKHGNKKRYYPDFIIDGTIYEIKGFEDDNAKLKSQYNPDIKVLKYDKIKPYLDYVTNKYGENFYDMQL